MKRNVPLILALLLLLSCAAGCRSVAAPTTEVWTSPGASVCAWFSGDDAEDSMGVNTDPLTLRVGKTAQGEDVFSLLRLPMRGTWLSGEIDSARLYLKIADGPVPAALRVGRIEEAWSASFTSLADARGLLESAAAETIAVRAEPDGWISIDITDYVVGWLNGDMPNNGLALSSTVDGEQTAFASDWNAENPDPPRLEVTGAVGNRDLTYGKFAYLRHPQNPGDDDALAEGETANCLSYALRDLHSIGAADLGLDYGEMTRICRESGEDAVAEYCAERILAYVEQHKTDLAISGFRRIDGFDSAIDPGKEYRIALRVGCHLYGDEDVLDEVEGNFDFHLWAQINDGRWAQKFMFDATEIVPCTPPGISPARYPWDASLEWGNDKFAGFYTSKVAYFAVTKDAEGWTEHKHSS